MKKLPALSIKQPWATLLAHGRKTIEVRRWCIKYRGTLLIHAARIPDKRQHAWDQVPPELLREASEQLGGIVGFGRIDSCKEYCTREDFVGDEDLHRNDPNWFVGEKMFGLCFTDLHVLPYQKVKGNVKLFTVEIDLEIPPPSAPAASLPAPHLCRTEEDHAGVAAVLERFPGNPLLSRIVARAMRDSRSAGTDGPKE